MFGKGNIFDQLSYAEAVFLFIKDTGDPYSVSTPNTESFENTIKPRSKDE